jgi:nucleotide-binding universal stress UspA family protein
MWAPPHGGSIDATGGETMKEILVGVDGSDEARAALEVGIDLAQGSGAQVTTIYVRHPQHSFVGSPYAQRALSAELARAKSALKDAQTAAAEAGVAMETDEVEGDPADQIIDLGRLRNVDLIVVGSRGLGTITGKLLGSVSTKVVQNADRPVLVARR